MANETNANEQECSEQMKAERHVEKTMDPMQHANDDVPPQTDARSDAARAPESVLPSAPEVSSGAAAQTSAKELETTDSPASAETAKRPFSEEDLSNIARKDAQAQDEPYEKDLDMEQPPKDFKPTAEEDEKATEAAVDDILHSDADAALQDALAIPNKKATVMKPSIFERLKNAWYFWWDNKWSRYGTIAFGVLLALLVIFIKPVRNFVMNAVGVRSSVMVTVLDGATNLPLQKATVSVDGVSGKTGEDGKLRLSGIHLGAHEMKVSKLAFASVKKEIDFGMRIVDVGEVTLKPTGQKLTFQFTDYLSGKPVADVSLTSGEATAKSNKDGKAVITIAPGSTESVKLTKEGLRTEEVELSEALQGLVQRKLVPSAPAIFVNKASGTYDVYKVYIDGKDRSVLLTGTGREKPNIMVSPKPDGSKVAVMASRDEKRNKDGYLLFGLYVVDTESGKLTNIGYAEEMMLLGWYGDRLLYRQTVAGTSAANPNRQKIIAYDFAANKRFQLASANQLADIHLVGDTLYYADFTAGPGAVGAFGRVHVETGAKKVLFTENAWRLQRIDYTKFKMQTSTTWFEYTLGTSAPVASTPPTIYGHRYFFDDPDGKTSAWVDIRDNNGVLLLRNLDDGKDTELATQKNMQFPAYWLGKEAIVYRVVGPSETADYVISVHGGEARKIADVSQTEMR
ncbi:hypothetical protein CSA80_03410 [Candidatus Saccharibacteria bacterium]|nr:MAG: hypothetical protein CSA80_03410 [Candidatus Saccharibacteria bacterium]